MKKGKEPNKILIIVIAVAVLLFVTHCKSLNKIPGVYVEPGGVSVEIGDFYYHN